MPQYSTCNKCHNVMEITGLKYKECPDPNCGGHWKSEPMPSNKIGAEWPAPGRPLQVAMNGGNMKRRNT